MRNFIKWLVLATCIICTSCTKEEFDRYYRSTALGGPYLLKGFNVDGETIALSDKSESETARRALGDGVDQADWYTSLSWITASYRSGRQELHLLVRENTTGEPRSCKIYATKKDGKTVCVTVLQSTKE